MLCLCHSKMKATPLYDARGIFVAYVCPKCERLKRKKYRTEIFTNPNYEVEEQLEPDE